MVAAIHLPPVLLTVDHRSARADLAQLIGEQARILRREVEAFLTRVAEA